MALLSNINDKFAVDSTGAIQFNGQVGTSGYVLKSNANAAPTWVDPSTVIGGPYLPLTGGTLTGNLAISGSNSLTVGGTLTGTSATFAGSGTFTTDSSNARVLFLEAGSPNGNIIQFMKSGTYKWELVGRDGTFYVYKNDGVGSGYKWQINTSGEHTFTGNATFAGDVQVTGAFKDSSGDAGTSGQILSSTATGTNWIDNDTGDISGSGVAGEVAYFTGTKTIANNAGMSFSNQQIQFDGIGGADGYILPYDQNPGYSNMAAGGFGLLFREAYDSYVTNNTYYYKTGGTSQWRAKYTTKGASVLSMLDGKFNFDTAPANTTSPYNLSLSTRMTILEGGNVGIGTTSPGAKLDVNGDVYVRETGALYVNTLAGYTSNVITLNSNTNFIVPSGNVGINETNPNAKLDVSGNVKLGSAAHSSWTDAKQDVGGLDVFVGSGSKALQVWDDNDQTNPRFVVERAGNVGIGTTSPGEKLEVAGTSGNTNIKVYDSSANSEVGIKLQNDAKTWTIQNWGSGGDNLRVLNNSGNTIQLWDDNGNVGIGTSSPDYNLEIEATDAKAFVHYVSASRGGIAAYSSQRIAFTTTGSSDDLVFGYNNGATATSANFVEHMRVDNGTGNVGIGNTSPQTTLHVGTTTTVTNQFTNQVAASNFFVNGNANGGASFFQCKTAAVNINMMGNNDFACNQFTFYHKPLSTSQNVVGTIATFSSSTQYNTTSDYRLKENIIPLSDSITRLKQLKPSRFNFIEDPERTMDGFLAHEVQNIVPEAVNGEKDAIDENGNEVHQGIDQAKLVPLLVAAIQELEARVKELENK